MDILSRLFGRRRDDLAVVVYTRSGCHLCDDAWRSLERLRSHYGFRLEAIDVDSDPALAARFGVCVPVVEVNGRIRSRGRFNEIVFRRLLDAKGG